MMKDIINPNVPIKPAFIAIKHPANHETFLELPANNVQQAPPGANGPRTFGIHHLTALTACQILTNEPGFLSSSSDRTMGPASMDLDAILTLKQYYYHLAVPQTDPLYPLCLDFHSWLFPHGQLPHAWERTVPTDEDEMVNIDSWTAKSAMIKMRDKRCRLSGWHDAISTAHIIPAPEATWMQHNEMSVYASIEKQTNAVNDVRNLFALRWDLHALLFDYAWWVIVPKGGEMVVHFIRESQEAAALYHNQKFDTNQLSHEFLFARFAWAIIKHAASGITTGLRKQFRLIVPNSGSAVSEPSMKEATVISKKRKVEDVVPSDGNTSKVNEAQELEEDLRLAKKVAPLFFEEPDMRRDRYHTMMWYPGKNIMERKKREYMDAHPNIRARSVTCPSLSSDDSDAEEEDHLGSADLDSYPSSEEAERTYQWAMPTEGTLEHEYLANNVHQSLMNP